MGTPKLCIRGCGEIATRPMRKTPSRSYCQKHWQALPSNQRAQLARLNPQRKAKKAAVTRRRIKFRGRAFYVKTDALAQQIRTHIRSRIHAFKTGQRAQWRDASAT